MKYCNNILETIGNTPLVKLNKIVEDIPALVLGKIETFNPGHSIKDRMALKMVEDAEASGKLKPGGTQPKQITQTRNPSVTITSPQVMSAKQICRIPLPEINPRRGAIKAWVGQFRIAGATRNTNINPDDEQNPN